MAKTVTESSDGWKPDTAVGPKITWELSARKGTVEQNVARVKEFERHNYYAIRVVPRKYTFRPWVDERFLYY